MNRPVRRWKKQGLPLLLALLTLLAQAPVYAGCLLPTPGETECSIILNAQEKKAVQKRKIIVRERSTGGKPGKIFEAVGLMQAERGIIRDIIKDYARYPEFMPNISSVEILQQDETATVLNQLLALPLGKSKKYRLKMEASEPDSKTSIIEWRLKPWPGLKPEETIRDTTGFWRIEELNAGNSLVLYHVYTDPGEIPFGLGWIIDLLSKDSLPELLTKTRDRAEKVSALKEVHDK